VDVDELASAGEESVWVWVGDTKLTQDDKKILTSGEWLTDNHIHAAQVLLKQQYPHISGLHHPILHRTKTYDVLKDQEFVQCVNLGSNHWITISTVGCDAAVINVYDSLNLRLPKSVKTLIADLMHTSCPSIRVNYINVQYQNGGNDCGLFAIAMAHAVCSGQDPSQLRFDQDLMRLHLVYAMENQLLMPFPLKCSGAPTTYTGKPPREDQIDIYCTCRLPDNGRRMVECSGCSKWYHVTCMNVSRRVLNNSLPWYCGRC
jgi:hypothetical protein